MLVRMAPAISRRETEMTRSRTIDRLPQELAYRANHGIEVWLLWTREANRLFVLVVDSKGDDTFEVDVDAGHALDAFHHPYAYAAALGIVYRASDKREAVYV
jgi:hypothetical protein